MINWTVVVGIGGLVLSMITFFLGQRKDSNTSGRELGEFMGRMDTKLENIDTAIKELKAAIKEGRRENTDAIEHAIKEHERAFHGTGSN